VIAARVAPRTEPDASAQLVLELRDVRRQFGSVAAVDGLSLTITPGEVFTLLGPSGCGKSTTLRIVAGLEQPDRGAVYLAGRLMASGEQGFSLAPEKRDLGMVFQSYAIWPHMTVFDNVAFPLQLRGVRGATLRDRVSGVLDLVGLSGLGSRGASELSGGQQQRVALARAIVMDPEILIYDEPFVGLDPISLGVILRLIRRLNDALGITSIVVSHDVQEISTVADVVFLLSGGKVVARGTPQELQSYPSDVVRQFIGGLADGPVPFHFPAPDYFSELLAREDA